MFVSIMNYCLNLQYKIILFNFSVIFHHVEKLELLKLLFFRFSKNERNRNSSLSYLEDFEKYFNK